MVRDDYHRGFWLLQRLTKTFVALTAATLSSLSFGPNVVEASKPIDRADKPLSAMPGNHQSGKHIFTDRELGHCVLCHSVSSLDVEFQGNIGPDLTAVALRLDKAELRFRIMDYSQVKDNVLMPPYYRLDNLNQVEASYRGKTILSGQQIEDIIAYLTSISNEGGAE